MKKFNILAFLFIFLISNNLVLSSEPINVDMVLQDQNEQARYNREKRNIEKNLRECLKENEGKEISKLGVPKVCAKFVKEFILMYGLDEFSKKIVEYEAIQQADE